LTKKWLESRDPKSGRRHDETPGRKPDGNKLFLKVVSPTKRYWIVRLKLKSRDTELSVGVYPATSITAAREARDKLVGEAHGGKHPRGGFRTSRSTPAAASKIPTFRQTAETYILGHENSWGRRHTQHWRSAIRDYCGPIADVPIPNVTTNMILEILTLIWSKKPETARRLRAQIETVLAAGYVRLDLDRANPARWKGWLDKQLPKIDRENVQHHPAMGYEDVPALMARLRQTNSVAAQCLALTILTATRTSEARQAQWGEINLGARAWAIPEQRMKKRRRFRVPLSGAAVAILEQRRQAAPDSEWVFTASWSKRPLSTDAMAKSLKRMKLDADVTVHGFRASFRSWCKSRGVQFEAAEEALAHVSGDATVKAYDRDDMFELRVTVMEEWARHCMGAK
jgi:integrase